jgi:nucleotide-binding universal stress UspA family protein
MLYTNVLVPLDGSKLSETVLPHVQAIAEKGLAANITFIRVVEATNIPTIGGDAVISSDSWSKLELERQKEADDYLKKLVSSLIFPAAINVKAAALSPGEVGATIIQYAIENKTDLIIMATHGRSGIGRVVWGSVAYHVLRSAYIPVLMIRPHIQSNS